MSQSSPALVTLIAVHDHGAERVKETLSIMSMILEDSDTKLDDPNYGLTINILPSLTSKQVSDFIAGLTPDMVTNHKKLYDHASSFLPEPDYD